MYTPAVHPQVIHFTKKLGSTSGIWLKILKAATCCVIAMDLGCAKHCMCKHMGVPQKWMVYMGKPYSNG